jgi:hypothetical protein
MIQLLLGLVILTVGIAGIFYVRRRKFYRRNVAGVEEFKSYGSAVATNFIESAIGAASFLIFLLGGIITLIGIVAILKG